MAENTDTMADKSPIERLAEKNKQAELERQRNSEIKPLSSPITPNEAAASGQATNPPAVDPTKKPAETADAKPLNIGQGENANGEKDSKEQFEQKSFEVQGHTKITREAADPDKKADPPDVVQQGGGGTIDAKTGRAVV